MSAAVQFDGLFHPFLNDENVKMIGVEAGGKGEKLGEHAGRSSLIKRAAGKWALCKERKVRRLQDENGQIALTHSISAGLDYASVGPEHALFAVNRAN